MHAQRYERRDVFCFPISRAEQSVTLNCLQFKIVELRPARTAERDDAPAHIYLSRTGMVMGQSIYSRSNLVQFSSLSPRQLPYPERAEVVAEADDSNDDKNAILCCGASPAKIGVQQNNHNMATTSKRAIMRYGKSYNAYKINHVYACNKNNHKMYQKHLVLVVEWFSITRHFCEVKTANTFNQLYCSMEPNCYFNNLFIVFFSSFCFILAGCFILDYKLVRLCS